MFCDILDVYHKDVMTSTWFVIGALFAGIGVVLGAFGAHGLRDKLSVEMLVVFETGVRYQLLHAITLLMVSWASSRWPVPGVNWAGWLFVAGILIFSGSLYVLAISGIRWLGAVTPLGGLCLILGWGILAVSVFRAS